MPVLELSRPDAPDARARALLFEDPLSLALLSEIARLAPTDATVLVTGETGTGKEILARHLHARSGRGNKPFVAVNSGALTPSLVESELFGYERGAFTGAVASRAGWFEAADGGTLFLDEIGDLPLAAQVKLLRVLQEREVVPVGGRRPIAIDVRLIAATHMDLRQAVAEGRFREDLYYRIDVARVHIAPLRDRPGDILPLAHHFLAAFASRLGVPRRELSAIAAERLLAYPWPGNIRELENAIHRALLVSPDGPVHEADLRLADRPRGTSHAPRECPAEERPDARAALEKALVALFEEEGPNLHEDIEEIVFRAAYEFSDKNQLRTARLLNVSRNVVRARLIRHGYLAAALRPSRNDVAAQTPALREGLTVRVGHQHLGALSLLKATGALEDGLAQRGATVEWVELTTGMQLIDGMAAGALDLGVVGEAPPVFAQAAFTPFVYLAAEPPAPQGEAIVVRPGSAVGTVADLRGKTLALTRGANVTYFVVRALEEAGIALTDVDVRPLGPAAARAAFLAGSVDAWAVWNPHLASLQHEVPVRILRDACGLADNRAFYIARRAFADAHPGVVDELLGQLSAVGRWANESPRVAAEALAQHASLAREVLEDVLASAELGARPIDEEAVASQQLIADAFHRLKLIARPLSVAEAVWARPWSSRRSA